MNNQERNPKERCIYYPINYSVGVYEKSLGMDCFRCDGYDKSCEHYESLDQFTAWINNRASKEVKRL